MLTSGSSHRYLISLGWILRLGVNCTVLACVVDISNMYLSPKVAIIRRFAVDRGSRRCVVVKQELQS
jgi:hypothetical protein